MNKQEIRVVLLSLLREIRKIVDSMGEEMSYEWTSFFQGTDVSEDWESLSEQSFENRKLTVEDVSYISFLADFIASGKLPHALEMDLSQPLYSVFNFLNGKEGNLAYRRSFLESDGKIHYPESFQSEDGPSYYTKALKEIRNVLENNLKGEILTKRLLHVMRKVFTFVPHSKEESDISLYDHSRTACAVSVCMLRYLESEKSEERKEWAEKISDIYARKLFLLYSMDISGIQKFIYTVHSKGALKALRARSFYLEILMEHIIDEFLDAMDLSRVNLLYSGGGHCYFLLPNTEEIKTVLNHCEEAVHRFFLEKYDIALYMATGSSPCSANDLRNDTGESYREVFMNIAKSVAEKKSGRYTAEDILSLNRSSDRGDRECVVCRRTSNLDDENRCPVCAAIHDFSKNILEASHFIVSENSVKGLPLPFDKRLIAVEPRELKSMERTSSPLRIYAKNKAAFQEDAGIPIWIGDYHPKSEEQQYHLMSFEEFAEKSEGIKRIAVLRADVDNLGTTFVYGFGDRVNLSRTATLSGQLSLFFKFYINAILQKGHYNVFGAKGNSSRAVSIVYSGGDDLFLVGSWDDLIEAAMDIQEEFRRFSCGNLSLSGGIGLYSDSYPVNVIAKEVEALESYSKRKPEKDAITIFDFNHRYSWEEFDKEVLKEKFGVIYRFFEFSENRGKSFLYHLLGYMENLGEKINIARFIYLLARLEPDKNRPKEEQEAYREFSEKMYRWLLNEKERHQAITAIYLYAYLTREQKEEKNNE